MYLHEVFFLLLQLEERTDCFTLCACCRVTVSVMCLFLRVLWVGLWFVVVAFPGHTHMRHAFFFVLGMYGFFSVCVFQWRSQPQKVTHIKGKLLDKAMILFNYVPFQKRNIS